MQHRLDAVDGEGVAGLPGQVRDRGHPVGGAGDDGETLRSEIPGKIVREIGTGQIKQRTRLLYLPSLGGRDDRIAQG